MRTLSIILVGLSLAITGEAQSLGRYVANVSIVFRPSDGTMLNPAEIKITPPAYPKEMRQAGISAEVAFKFTVQKDGRVADVVITKASHLDFKPAVEEAITHWKFEPLKEDGHGVSRPLVLFGKITFSLSDE